MNLETTKGCVRGFQWEEESIEMGQVFGSRRTKGGERSRGAGTRLKKRNSLLRKRRVLVRSSKKRSFAQWKKSSGNSLGEHSLHKVQKGNETPLIHKLQPEGGSQETDGVRDVGGVVKYLSTPWKKKESKPNSPKNQSLQQRRSNISGKMAKKTHKGSTKKVELKGTSEGREGAFGFDSLGLHSVLTTKKNMCAKIAKEPEKTK